MLAGFGVDVLDPATSPRRIAELVARLPPAVRRPGQEWSTESELLALLIDHVAQLTYVTLRLGGSRNAPKPRPLRRPITTGPGAGRPARDNGAPPPARKTSWLDAAGELAAIPGVIVEDGGDG